MMTMDCYIYPHQPTRDSRPPSAVASSSTMITGSYGSSPFRVPYLDEDTFQLFDRAITQANSMHANATASSPSSLISQEVIDYILYTEPELPHSKRPTDVTRDDSRLQLHNTPHPLGLKSPFVSPSPVYRSAPVAVPKPTFSLDVFPDIPIASSSRMSSAAGIRTPSPQVASSSPAQQTAARQDFSSMYSVDQTPGPSMQAASSSSVEQAHGVSPSAQPIIVVDMRRNRPNFVTQTSPMTPPQNLTIPHHLSPSHTPTPTSPAPWMTPKPTTSVSPEQAKPTFSELSLQVYKLLCDRARRPHGLAGCTTLRREVCMSIISQVYTRPAWLLASFVDLCEKSLAEFGRKNGPDERKSIRVHEDVGWHCVRIGSEVKKSWLGFNATCMKDKQVVLGFAPDEGIPMDAVLDFQHSLFYPSIKFDVTTGCYSIKRFQIPTPMSSPHLERVQFGLDKNIGVPVRLTAECVWTVADGHKRLFGQERPQDDSSVQEVILQLVWPGYSPAYPKVYIPYSCTRQEFARIICTEILVWGAVSAASPISEGCERWDIKNAALLESLWLVSANRWENGLWTVELHLNQKA